MDRRRRRLLGLLGAVAGLGSAKAIYNVLLGYGKNLKTQNLSSTASDHLYPSPYVFETDGYELSFDGTSLGVTDLSDGGESPHDDLYLRGLSPEEASEVESRLGLSRSPVRELSADVPRIHDGDYVFEFHGFDSFFDRIRDADTDTDTDSDAETRPFTVGALRGGWDTAYPSIIRDVSGASPRNPREVLEGLVEAFRDQTSYDLPRYAAGAITDNILMKTVRLRRFFSHPVDYEAVSQGGTRMFCYEYTNRSIESIHSVPPHQQSPPVVGAKVHDYRHKHVYTAVASVLREGDRLVIPMTFVDYTHSTLYDDLSLTPVLGEGFEAYGDRHRADAVYWSRNS